MQGRKDDLTPSRRRRVQILKKIIIGTVLSLIVIPCATSLMLGMQVYFSHSKVSALEGRILEFEANVQDMSRQIEELSKLCDSRQEEIERLSSELKDIRDGVATVTSSENLGQTWLLAGKPEGNGFEAVREQDSTDEGIGRDKLPDEDLSIMVSEDAEPMLVNPDTAAHRIYLTFDDGPSETTGEILDILAEYNVKATFFINGRQPDNEVAKTLIKRIVNEGHTIGMHSYSHQYATIYASKDAFVKDYEKIHQYILDVTGVDSKFYRFPGGSSNSQAKGVKMSTLFEFLSGKGVDYFDWNAMSGDAESKYINKQTGMVDVDVLVENALKDISKRSDTVILMHDGTGKKTTVEALPEIIERIKAMESTVILPITEDTTPIKHVI